MSELENNSQKTDKRKDVSNINKNNKMNQMDNQTYKDSFDYNLLRNLLSTELIDSLDSNNGTKVEKHNKEKLLNENIQNYGKYELDPIHFEQKMFKENNINDDNNNIYMNNESDGDSSSSNLDMDPDEFFKKYNLAIHKSNENNNIENKNDLNINNGLDIVNSGDDNTKNNAIIDVNNKPNINPLSLGNSIENKKDESNFKFPSNDSQQINPNLYYSYEPKNKFSNSNINNQINVDNFTKTVNNNNDLNLIKNNNNMNNNSEIQKEAFNSMNNDLKQINKLEPKDYLIRMFGKYGWICRICNNFNFETRNKCNRCFYYKLPKTLIEINKQKEENKKLHKKKAKEKKTDWICLNCNNLNYAFRKFCNRCQIERNDLNVFYPSENHNINTNNNNIYNLAYSGNVNEFGGEYNNMFYPSNNYNPNYNDISYQYENENINSSGQSNLNKNNNIFPYISIFKK